MAGRDLLQRCLPPNPHCQLGREFGISDRRKQIVERREPNCAIDVQQAEILGVGIRITDDQVENSRVRQFRYRSRRMRYRLPKQREAVFERSEEHTSELQSLMRISYAVCCLKKQLIT